MRSILKTEEFTMKMNAAIIALMAISSTAMATESLTAAPQLDPICNTVIRAAVAALESGGLEVDQTTGAVTIDKAQLDNVAISNVKIIRSSCRGPADCDAQHPDQFTYGADLGKKGDMLVGKVVASYHRGNCVVTKILLK
jgi:hypothetical protein